MKTLTSVLLLAVTSASLGVELRVASGGSDSNPGTSEKPLASLVGARDAIRKLKDGKPLAETVRVIVDPQLRDPKQDNFDLLPDSPAIKLGFKPFDWREAGVYGDAEWVRQAKDVTYPPLELPPNAK
jgi:hypothetical protein